MNDYIGWAEWANVFVWWLCGAADRIRLPIQCIHAHFIVSPRFSCHTLTRQTSPLVSIGNESREQNHRNYRCTGSITTDWSRLKCVVLFSTEIRCLGHGSKMKRHLRRLFFPSLMCIMPDYMEPVIHMINVSAMSAAKTFFSLFVHFHTLFLFKRKFIIYRCRRS